MNIMMVWLARNWKGTPFPKTDYIWYEISLQYSGGLEWDEKRVEVVGA